MLCPRDGEHGNESQGIRVDIAEEKSGLEDSLEKLAETKREAVSRSQ